MSDTPLYDAIALRVFAIELAAVDSLADLGWEDAA